jgi:hypothetical protein
MRAELTQNDVRIDESAGLHILVGITQSPMQCGTIVTANSMTPLVLIGAIDRRPT